MVTYSYNPSLQEIGASLVSIAIIDQIGLHNETLSHNRERERERQGLYYLMAYKS